MEKGFLRPRIIEASFGQSLNHLMEAVDIITAVKETPDYAGREVAWVGKLEEQTAGEMTFLIRRKLFKDDQIHYMVRVVMNQTMDLVMGDKALLTGTISDEIEVNHIEQGLLSYVVLLENAEISPLNSSGKRQISTYAEEVME